MDKSVEEKVGAGDNQNIGAQPGGMAAQLPFQANDTGQGELPKERPEGKLLQLKCPVRYSVQSASPLQIE